MLCRDCKHWGAIGVTLQQVKDYPKDLAIADGYITGACSELKFNIDVDISGDGVLSGIITDANFGCILFEQRV